MCLEDVLKMKYWCIIVFHEFVRERVHSLESYKRRKLGVIWHKKMRFYLEILIRLRSFSFRIIDNFGRYLGKDFPLSSLLNA